MGCRIEPVTLLLAIAVGLAAAYVGSRSPLPAGGIVFPILAVAGLQLLTGRSAERFPGWGQLIVYGLLGTLVGLSIDRPALSGLREHWPILLLMAVSVYVVAIASVLVIARLAHFDLATALLAGLPGGAATVIGASSTTGVNSAQVVTVQTLRLLLIYGSLPLLLLALRARG